MLERAKRVISHQTMTMSKRADQRTQNAPSYIVAAKGNLLYSADNKIYIDYMCGLGTNILGYKYISTEKGYSGYSPSLPTVKEVELAEKLVEIIPCAEMVRLLKTGSEACNAAVRIARAYTKRDFIATCGYHGWHDIFNYKEPGFGTPQRTKELIGEFKYNDIASLKKLIDTKLFACVIMEPVMLDKPDSGYLQAVRDLCDKTGTVLIFDEIITGFWWGVGGYQKECSVIPDLATFGKAMGNGMSISAVVGKREIMDNDYFISSTFAGETSGIDYALATIKEIERRDYKERNEKAKILFDEINKKVKLRGFPWRGAFPITKETAIFWQEAVKGGVLFGKPYFFNFAVTDEILEKTLKVVKNINMNVQLEGPMPTEIIKDGR
jgi:glutamate-1-semialdehyde 2,1-aminomutase